MVKSSKYVVLFLSFLFAGLAGIYTFHNITSNKTSNLIETEEVLRLDITPVSSLKMCTFNRKNRFRSYALGGLFPDSATHFITSYVCIPSFSAEFAMVLTHSDSAGYLLKSGRFSENAYYASKKKKAISIFKNERFISDSLGKKIITLFEFTHNHLHKLSKRHGLDGTTHYVSVCDSNGVENISKVESPLNETVSGRLVQSIVAISSFISSSQEEKEMYFHLKDILEEARKTEFNPDENSGDSKNIKKRRVSFTKDLGALKNCFPIETSTISYS